MASVTRSRPQRPTADLQVLTLHLLSAISVSYIKLYDSVRVCLIVRQIVEVLGSQSRLL